MELLRTVRERSGVAGAEMMGQGSMVPNVSVEDVRDYASARVTINIGNSRVVMQDRDV